MYATAFVRDVDENYSGLRSCSDLTKSEPDIERERPVRGHEEWGEGERAKA